MSKISKDLGRIGDLFQVTERLESPRELRTDAGIYLHHDVLQGGWNDLPIIYGTEVSSGSQSTNWGLGPEGFTQDLAAATQRDFGYLVWSLQVTNSDSVDHDSRLLFRSAQSLAASLLWRDQALTAGTTAETREILGGPGPWPIPPNCTWFFRHVAHTTDAVEIFGHWSPIPAGLKPI